jgi:hypothetical protein
MFSLALHYQISSLDVLLSSALTKAQLAVVHTGVLLLYSIHQQSSMESSNISERDSAVLVVQRL